MAYKRKMLDRLIGRGAISARQLSIETGVRQQTLSRWVQEASSVAPMPSEPLPRGRPIDERLRILTEANGLSGTELAGVLVREGVLLTDLEQWRLALMEDGRGTMAMAKRIRALERELARKEKALAEAAALLLLKKKMTALWEAEDVDTAAETEG